MTASHWIPGIGHWLLGQRSKGVMLATVLAIFFIPLFYVVVRKLAGVPLNGKPKENAPH